MTAPEQDTPLATVPAGLSEVVLILSALGGLLAALFGQDWGLREHAQDIASAAFVIAPAVLGLIRAMKHRGAQHANALVVASRATAAPGYSIGPVMPTVSDL